ncbi:galactosyl transferase GMA12/MNN10 family-domain-containing protein [Zychaea mexicana]|uniref:galactosyl transferase GMA12/MNN10 family-domain-containing protein n=1 Tax=Zychaea mexicana TaxID=64656 RepID=UPI0022FECAF5|nr:galactosyl transferase GMA12/MNN10 family-domain-containing protein [Zychaea mexicana]KAI9484593.1 galactosyl transferase GMA12/MNN10 family-domain-containing protein [Zychaea mexicana]
MPSRRPRTNKRTLAALAVVGIFFLLFLNARVGNSDSSSSSSSSSSSPSSVHDPSNKEPSFKNDKQQDELFPAPNVEQPDVDVQQPPSDIEDPDLFPALEVEDDSASSEAENILPDQELFPTTPKQDQGLEDEVKAGDNAVSPHSDHHSTLPHLLAEDNQDDIILNESNHYTYLVVIASPPDQMSRRQLIREKYFGLRDNLLPCMRYNTDMLYKFWIYGNMIPAKTDERRRYEAEKMEWDDLEEMGKGVKFEQTSILEWAETTLAERGITYDYLIVQDINAFVQLVDIKRELDNGVISESTNSPVAINTDTPTNLVWGNFAGKESDKHAFVVGSAAVKLAVEKQAEITLYDLKVPHILTNMYNYYDSIATDVESAVDATLEPEAAAEEQERVIPLFIREDGPDDNHRFIRWENNVESVHAEDSVVTHIYQDSEFADLARWTYLKPSPVCYPRKSAFKDGQPPLDPLDDDQEASDATTDDDPEFSASNTTASASSEGGSYGPSIALMTSSFIYPDNCMEPSATLSAINKRKYAVRHGHSFVARSTEFAQQRGRKTVWGKIDAIEKVLPKYDWIFWADMDAVIFNQERSLFELLDELRARYPGGEDEFDKNVDLIVSRPPRDPTLNAGVFFMRNSPWSMQFLREVQNNEAWYNKGSAYEQGAMAEISEDPRHKDHVFLLYPDVHTFNTFPKFYQPGDFIVHYAPDKCPSPFVLKGLEAAERIENGEVIDKLI